MNFTQRMPNQNTTVFNRRLWVVLLLGFSSGLPLGLSGATLQAWYATAGIDIKTIGLLTLVGQPYIIKFLWAPVIDKLRLPWLTHRRDWMLAMQVALMFVLIAMAQFEPAAHTLTLALLGLLLAFVSATQDIAFDAYRTEVLKPEERGMGAAMSVAGYRIAMIIAGGIALMLAHYVGFQKTYLLMAGSIGVGVLGTLLAPALPAANHPELTWRQVLVEPWSEWLKRDSAILLLILIVLYPLADAFAGRLSIVFLLKGLSLDLMTVGWLNKVVGLIATIAGAFAGGALLTRWPLYKSLVWFGVLQALSNSAYLALAATGVRTTGAVTVAVLVENFCSGLGTSALVALLMALCHPQFAATQFALLTAVSAVGRVWVGPVSGVVADYYGWAMFFGLSILAGLPGLLLLGYLKRVLKGLGQDYPSRTTTSDPIPDE